MIYFLSSIPRSGSTLLASLLEQREDTYVSPTSELGALQKAISCLPNVPAPIFEAMKGQFYQRYANRKEKYVFDKGRMWPEPSMMERVREFQGEVKIVATVRPLVECISSFYLVEKTDLPVEDWIANSNTFKGLMQAYEDLKNGYEASPENFCLVAYDDLCDNTQHELNRISDFIGSPVIKYMPEIEQVEDNDRDNMWGIDGLHTLRPTIGRDMTDPRTVLGLEIYNEYADWDFWSVGETTMQLIEA